MKYILSVAFFIATCATAIAQTATPTYGNTQNLPAFKIYLVPDSTQFTNQGLVKNKSCVVMFFNPECEHCQRETKELLAYKEELKGVQLVMVSAASFDVIKDFYKEYNLAAMPGIKMGYDAGHAFSMKYQLRTLPSLFVYDAGGKMKKEFVGNIGVPAILEALK